MNSFRLFVKSFGKEPIRRSTVLAEMARRTADKQVPIFDEDDRRYFKHIYENAPDWIKEKDKYDSLVSLMRAALLWRYGNKDRGGMLHDNPTGSPDVQDKVFRIGNTSIPITGIPVYPSKVADKITARGLNWAHPFFGFDVGSYSVGAKQRAKAIVDFLTNGDEMNPKIAVYNPPDKVTDADASDDVKTRHIASQEKGRHKHTQDRFDSEGLGEEKSMKAIKFDNDDQMFLNSFETRFREQYADMGVMIDPELEYLKPYALGMRYSDHFITKDETGNFVVRPEFVTDAEPQGAKYVDLHIPWRRVSIPVTPRDDKPAAPPASPPPPPGGMGQGPRPAPKKKKPAPPSGPSLFDGFETYRHWQAAVSPLVEGTDAGITGVRVTRVLMNLPELVKKFALIKKSRDFVRDPMIPREDDPTKRSRGRNAAKRWLENPKGEFVAQQGTVGGEVLRNTDFFNQIVADHDAWRNKKPAPPIVSKKIDPNTLTWRKGGEIAESPNIPDAGVKYNADEMSLIDVLQKDANEGVRKAIQILSGTKYAKRPEWTTWAHNSNNYEHAVQVAFTALTTNKTGSPPDEYRSQSQRIRWAQQEAMRAFERLARMASSGEGGKGKDDAPSPFDTAAAPGAGDGVNTGTASHRTDNPTSGGTSAGSIGDDDADYDYDFDQDPQDAPYTAQHAPSPQQQQFIRPTSGPTAVSLKQWIGMSDAEKLAAMRAAGLI